ncbi:DUF2155 domain-containing protein [Gluconacetobacter entanii]|uniref:DUF2155 domain-containing protein n=1 Tax=Gluconacetobacter entanii TaxID=108528 RepID=A0A318PVW9_9PROT|nr:DUF2155 domain-containing protein [Gluconacetobacter entanii]MCE2578988.1 DUF2155 domain-containing protein [Komagataeibacter sp. FNDCR1]PYD64349.1 hypothetical protein CFR72_02595 [Gluconacetobacter entanii]
MRRQMRAAALAVSLLGGVAAPWVPVARADAPQWLPPPAMYPPDTWKGRGSAVVRILDKLDAHVQVLDIPAGQDATYKSLTLHARACLERPPTLAADTAAWLSVHDAHEGMMPFDGWMLRQEPALGVFQNPLYDVQVVGCGGADVAPIPPPLAVVQQQQAAPPVTPGAESTAPAPVTAAAPPPQGTTALPPPPPMLPPPQPVARPAAPVPAPPPAAEDGSAAAPLLLH